MNQLTRCGLLPSVTECIPYVIAEVSRGLIIRDLDTNKI